MKKLTKFNAPKIAIALALILAAGKGTVGFFCGSLAIMSAAFDSILDVIASMINLIFIKKADAPPDFEHQFGHGKMEAYAALLQSVIIFITGLLILYTAAQKILNPVMPNINILGISMMLIAIAFSLIITVMLSKIAERENSQALRGDALHYRVDVLTNFAILIAVLIVKFSGLTVIDPIVGGTLALYIMANAVRLHLSSLNIILDRGIPTEELKKLEEKFKLFSAYQHDYHQLRTRTDGNRIFADVHVTLCRTISLLEAHAIVDKIEETLCKGNNVDLLVHPEPCPGNCNENCKRKAVLDFLKSEEEKELRDG
ncbi:MAG: cation diffusion facilitator family transporter [Deferribacteraceae bacterium]|jgi:cation diffusion facilitator family transporter|nr:cation diffusion facilitator family transporter [Deferribacteraceae bacterium]